MIYRFDPFSLDTESLELRNGGDVIPVEPQVFSTLAYLIENRERVVGKDELIEAVWDGRAISDGALNSRINAARRAVGDDGSAQSVIKTFTRRGFRFIATVSGDAEPDSPAALPASLTGKPSIAVLPFNNLSNDPEQEYFADGITEDIITALSRLRQFYVIARNTSFTYKGRTVDIQAVARDLGARYVLEGSVRKSGNRLRITAQLIDGGTGNHVLAERYDRDLEDIFEVQDELSMTLAAAIAPALGSAELQRAQTKKPENIDVWDLYQRGLWRLNQRNPESIAEASTLFEQAMAMDANFGPAFSGYAWLYQLNSLYGLTGMDAQTAKAAALRAVALDNDDPFAHFALGQIHCVERDLAAAIQEFQVALELNPSFTDAYHRLAICLIHHGQPQDAMQHLDTCIRLSRDSMTLMICYADYCLAWLYLHDYAQAVVWGEKTIRQPVPLWPAYVFHISALVHLGDLSEAENVLAKLRDSRPDISISFVRDRLFDSDKSHMELLLDGLRKAGLPE